MIVVDTSAIVDALGVADGAEGLQHRLAADPLHAPALLDDEFVSVLRRLCLQGRISTARAEDMLTDFNDLPIQRWDSPDAFRRRAFQLRNNVSAYEAAFIILAEALECPVVTRDVRLARAVGLSAQVEIL